MKTVSFLLAATVLIFAGCNKNDDDDDQATPKKQLLAKVRFVEEASLALDADYKGDKLTEIRELPRDVITRYHDFTFDAQGKVTTFTKTEPGLQGITVLKHQLTYSGDFLQDITVTQEGSGASVFFEDYRFVKKDSTIRVVRRNKSLQSVAQRTATYNSQGNMIRLVQQSLPGGEPDTVEYANYDQHPNMFETLTWYLDTHDFLPPSANNVGTVTSRRGNLPPAVNQLTYEYNKQGNPAKVVQKGRTMLFEYKEL